MSMNEFRRRSRFLRREILLVDIHKKYRIFFFLFVRSFRSDPSRNRPHYARPRPEQSTNNLGRARPERSFVIIAKRDFLSATVEICV